MKVCVLGCGPAGLAAAQAAVDLGAYVTITSIRWKPSEQHGCQYLHAPIPGYEDVPKVRVSYFLNGTPEEYRQKVYGNDWSGRVSPEDFIGEHDAWDIRETYRRMWTRFDENWRVTKMQTPVNSGVLPDLLARFDRVISTIPAWALCWHTEDHEFREHQIYARGSINHSTFKDQIICDGTREHDWYRISSVFGYRTTEWPSWPGSIRKPLGSVRVTKPLSTDCDCYPTVIRVGRYGAWQKAALVHEVYGKVAGELCRE